MGLRAWWPDERMGPGRLVGVALGVVVAAMTVMAGAAVLGRGMMQRAGLAGVAGWAGVAGLMAVVLVAGSLVICSRTVRLLRKGVAEARWDAAAMGPVRRVMGWAAWNGLVVVCLLLLASALMWPRHGGVRLLGSMLLWPVMMVNSLRLAVRDRREQPASELWSGTKPLRSEHWGERGVGDGVDRVRG